MLSSRSAACILLSTFLVQQVFADDWLDRHCGTRNADGTFKLRFAGRSPRPDWMNGIRNRFELAHFGRADYPIPVDANNEPLIKLNHVYSWSNLRFDIGHLLKIAFEREQASREDARDAESYVGLETFIRYLFTIDRDAYVNNKSTKNLFRRRNQRHNLYLNANGAGLVNQNTLVENAAIIEMNQIDYYAEAHDTTGQVRAANCQTAKTLLKKAFNAPANLRFGEDDNLGDTVDPMGNGQGIMTAKDYAWFSRAEYKPLLVTPIGRSYYLGSSTGLDRHGHDGYYIRCLHNNARCSDAPIIWEDRG